MFYFNFERKNYKALTFNIVYFANFEIINKRLPLVSVAL